MSVQPEDRTTIDMFSSIRPGRPKSSPYDRVQQSRFNKRSQRMRDKHQGFHRLEVKMSSQILETLDDACEDLKLSRAEVVELALKQWLHV